MIKKPLANTDALWTIVKTDLELKVVRGEYLAGERLPSIRNIAQIYNIGVTTARKAVYALAREGTICVSRGKGYYIMPFVKDKLNMAHKKQLEKLLREAMDYGIGMGLTLEELYERMKSMQHHA